MEGTGLAALDRVAAKDLDRGQRLLDGGGGAGGGDHDLVQVGCTRGGPGGGKGRGGGHGRDESGRDRGGKGGTGGRHGCSPGAAVPTPAARCACAWESRGRTGTDGHGSAPGSPPPCPPHRNQSAPGPV